MVKKQQRRYQDLHATLEGAPTCCLPAAPPTRVHDDDDDDAVCAEPEVELELAVPRACDPARALCAIATLAALLMGCGGDNSAANAPAGDDVTPAGGPTNRCGLPNAKTLVPLRKYENGYDSDNARAERFQVDGDKLFFSAGKQLYSVSTNGGTPTSLHTAQETIGVFWVVGDQVIVGPARGSSLDVLPKTGGAATSSIKLPSYYEGSHNIVLSPDGSTFFVKKDGIAVADAFQYWRFDWKTGDALDLVGSLTLGYSGPIVLQGNYLYTGKGSSPLGLSADAIYRVSIDGGEPEAVPVDGDLAMELIGSDSDNLYVFAERSETEPQMYRIPLAGGAPEAVFNPKPFGLVGVAFEGSVFVNLTKRAVVQFEGQIFELPRSGEGRTLFASQCVVSAFASNDTDAFLATLDNSDRVEVFRVPLP